MLYTFRIKNGPILKLGKLIKCYKRKIFTENNAENVHWKLVLDLYLTLRSNLEYSLCIQKTRLQMKYFERGLSKIPKKSNFIYFLNSVPFPGNHYKNKRGLELVSSIFTDCQICSKVIFLQWSITWWILVPYFKEVLSYSKNYSL